MKNRTKKHNQRKYYKTRNKLHHRTVTNQQKHKHKQKTKNKKNIQCAPSKSKKKYSCYSNKSLHNLKHYWNARHPDSKIKTNDMYMIWSQLKANMKDTCDSESCWLKQKFIKHNLNKELLNYTFAPKSPQIWKKKPNEWLTSLDIDKVMKQYEYTHKNFVFLGPSPIDFDHKKVYGQCVWEELCNFNLENYIKEGKKKIGIVFNLDPHYKEGSHWIALFIDIEEQYIFFFDSNGDKIPKQIMKLVHRIQKQAEKLNRSFLFEQNYPKEHQKGTTECGIYVLYFIITLLTHKKPITFFKNHTITDKEMGKLRKKYFNETL
jgi:hypothetical protein